MVNLLVEGPVSLQIGCSEYMLEQCHNVFREQLDNMYQDLLCQYHSKQEHDIEAH